MTISPSPPSLDPVPAGNVMTSVAPRCRRNRQLRRAMTVSPTRATSIRDRGGHRAARMAERPTPASHRWGIPCRAPLVVTSISMRGPGVAEGLSRPGDAVASPPAQLPLEIRVLEPGVQHPGLDADERGRDLVEIAKRQRAFVELPVFEFLPDQPAHDLIDPIRGRPGQRAHRGF